MSTQTEAVIARIRELIMRGEFPAGGKLGEAALADRLQVSRTPVRLALGELAKEGLLEHAPNRGFVARGFTTKDIIDAVAVRERLDAMAAGLAARRGLNEAQHRRLESCLLQVDGILAKPEIEHRDVLIWIEVNGDFHEAIVEAADNRALTDATRRIENIPFAGSRHFAATYKFLDRQRDAIAAAQIQHRWTFDAIVEGDAERAENMMRQHVRDGGKNLGRVLSQMHNPENADPRFKLLRAS